MTFAAEPQWFRASSLAGMLGSKVCDDCGKVLDVFINEDGNDGSIDILCKTCYIIEVEKLQREKRL